MTPDALNASSFDRYPPQAGQWCIRHLDLLRRLPLVVGPSFLEQAIAYDWKFPVEKRKLSAQAAALEALAPEAFVKLIAAFADIAVPAALEHSDWVNQPAQFDELLTTHLWSTRRIDQYRQAAKALLDSAPGVGASTETVLPENRQAAKALLDFNGSPLTAGCESRQAQDCDLSGGIGAGCARLPTVYETPFTRSARCRCGAWR